MRLRFLRTTISDVSGYPFQPGQTIVLDRLTRQMRDWIANGDAIVVEEHPPEVAVAPAHPETAVAETPRKRGR